MPALLRFATTEQRLSTPFAADLPVEPPAHAGNMFLCWLVLCPVLQRLYGAAKPLLSRVRQEVESSEEGLCRALHRVFEGLSGDAAADAVTSTGTAVVDVEVCTAFACVCLSVWLSSCPSSFVFTEARVARHAGPLGRVGRFPSNLLHISGI